MHVVTTRIQSLGEQMAERRKRLGLSQSAAARTAGVGRTTWVAWEKDAQRPEDFNHVKIETSLKWLSGGVQTALDGGKAQEAPDEPELKDEAEEAIWEINELPPALRMRYIARHRQRKQTGQTRASNGP